MRYKFVLLSVFVICSLQKGFAQMYVKDILNDKIPVPYTGKLLQAYEYKDNAGLHVFILSRKKEFKPQLQISIFCSAYTQTNGSFVKDWSIQDFTYRNLLVYYTHTKIVDIDNDGIYETLFVYQLNPDEQAGEWKVMLHYKNQKYALRVHIPMFGAEQLGVDKTKATPDKSIDTLPDQVKKYLKDYWNDVADRNELGITYE